MCNIVNTDGVLHMNDCDEIIIVDKTHMRVYDNVYNTLEEAGYEQDLDGNGDVFPVNSDTVIISCIHLDRAYTDKYIVFFDLEKDTVVSVYPLQGKYGKIIDVLVTSTSITVLYDVELDADTRWFAIEKYDLDPSTKHTPIADSYVRIAESYYSSAKLVGENNILYKGNNKNVIVTLPNDEAIRMCPTDTDIHVVHGDGGKTYWAATSDTYYVFGENGDYQIFTVDEDNIMYLDTALIDTATHVIPGESGIYVTHENDDSTEVRYYEFGAELGGEPRETMIRRYCVASGGKYALTGKDGYRVTGLEFDDVKVYDDIRVASINNLYGVYDATGRCIHRCGYDGADTDYHGLVRLYTRDDSDDIIVSSDTGLILVKGDIKNYRRLGNAIMVGTANDKWGMFVEGNLLIECVFEKGYCLSELGVWVTEKNGDLYIYNSDGVRLPSTNHYKFAVLLFPPDRFDNLDKFVSEVEVECYTFNVAGTQYLAHDGAVYTTDRQRLAKPLGVLFEQVDKKLTSLGL